MFPIRKATALMLTGKAAQPVPVVFDPSKVKIIDAHWFPDGLSGPVHEAQCVFWVDYQSLLQRFRELEEVLDGAIFMLDKKMEEDHVR